MKLWLLFVVIFGGSLTFAARRGGYQVVTPRYIKPHTRIVRFTRPPTTTPTTTKPIPKLMIVATAGDDKVDVTWNTFPEANWFMLVVSNIDGSEPRRMMISGSVERNIRILVRFYK